MHVLAERFAKILRKDGRVPHAARTDLRNRLGDLRPWWNALCHGAWLGVDADGTGVLCHYYKKDNLILQFQPRVTLKELADIRARIVDVTIRVTETSAVAGSGLALAAVMPRKYEPRNAPPERE